MFFDEYFEKRRARKAREARIEAANDAIEGGTLEKIQRAFEATSNDRPSGSDKGWWLKLAIDRQNVEVFNAVLGLIGDPNTTISYTTGSGTDSDPRRSWNYDPIYYAIAVKRTHDIALTLASDTRTRISDQYRDAAKTGGMADIAAVLSKRLADLRRVEADQLEKDAAQLSAGPQAAAAEASPPETVSDTPNETWTLVSKTSLAHVTTAEAINRKLTEIFNFDSKERVLISENLKTNQESPPETVPFEKLGADVVRRAEDMLAKLTKKSFNI